MCSKGKGAMYPVKLLVGLTLLLQTFVLLTGCTRSTEAQSSQGTDIIIFVDFSQSVQGNAMKLFEQDVVNQIVPTLSAGDQILIAPISDKTLTDFHPLVEVTFPPKPAFNGWMDNVLKHNRLVKSTDTEVGKLREQARKQIAELFAKRYSSPETDIFSSLIIAKKLFHNDRRQKVLVLMSDMIEDYPPYRFDRMTWTAETSTGLLSELDARGLIPDLSGVCIYVTGASARSAEMAQNIAGFWNQYFKRSRADMDPSRYAHVLLHWPPSKSCSI
jgi:hypothetical protein